MKLEDLPYRWGTPGRVDVDGVEWWAGDPYPTWYRHDENGELVVDRPQFPTTGDDRI